MRTNPMGSVPMAVEQSIYLTLPQAHENHIEDPELP